MKLISLHKVSVILIASMILSPLAHGQGVLSKTTLGGSQNDSRDLVNSLIPGPQRVGKGEKKEEVDPKKLPSKTIKDPTFQGNLMDIGLDWTGDKLGKSRPTSDSDSKSAKKENASTRESEAAGEKDSKASKSTDAVGDGQNKEQKAVAVTPGEKPSEKEKASAGKPGGSP